MRCPMVREHIKAYIDGELGPVMRWRVARHLAGCMECSMEAEAMTDLARQVAAAGEARAPEGLREKVLDRVQFEAAGAQWSDLQARYPEQPAPARWRWPYATSPIAVAGVLLFTVVAATVLTPMFLQEKMNSKAVSKTYRPTPAASNIAPKQPSYYNSGEVTDRNSKMAALRPPVAAIAKRPAAAAKPGLAEPNSKAGFRQSNARPAPRQAVCKFSAPVTKPSVMAGCQPRPTNGTRDRLTIEAIAPNTPLFVFTADMTVLAKDIQQASDQAAAIAKSAGGLVVRSSTKSNTDRPGAISLILRVPKARFKQTVEQLCALGSVKRKTVNDEDVSAKVAELTSQLRSKQTGEPRQEIEEVTKRLDDLKSSAAMSAVSVTLVEAVKE